MSNNDWSNSELGAIGAIHIDTYAKKCRTKKRARATKKAWGQHYLSDDTLGNLGRFKRAKLKATFRKIYLTEYQDYIQI